MLTGIVAGTITCIPNAAMNYRNYSRSIQSKHGVQIVGWPSTCPFKNPSQISTVSSLKNLRNALSTGVCAWRRMSEAEIAAIDLNLEQELESGTITKKARTKNKKNVTRTTASHTIHLDKDSDESDGEERERDMLKRKKGGAATDGEDNEPPLKKKKVARKQPQKKGIEVTKTSKRSNVTQRLPPGPSSKEFINTTDDNSE
jgi:hypothetical protein